MAIKACEDCGKDRSDTAQVCPHCGHRRKSPWGRRLLYAAGAVGVALAGMAYLGNSPEAQERSAQRQAINLCRQGDQTNTILRGACADMERKFRQTWGTDP